MASHMEFSGGLINLVLTGAACWYGGIAVYTLLCFLKDWITGNLP